MLFLGEVTIIKKSHKVLAGLHEKAGDVEALFDWQVIPEVANTTKERHKKFLCHLQLPETCRSLWGAPA
jgi:hypothetical protein